MEKAETEATVVEEKAAEDAGKAEEENDKAEDEEEELDEKVEEAELAEEKAKDKFEDCGCNIADIPVAKKNYEDLSIKRKQLQVLRDAAKASRELAKKRWDELKKMNEKAHEIAIKMRKARELTQASRKLAMAKMVERRKKMWEMIRTAKEKAQENAQKLKDLGTISTKLVEQTNKNDDK